MKKLLFLAILTGFTAMTSCRQKIHYPVAKKVDTVDNYFGTSVADPYRWLENDTSKETEAWVIAEN